MRMEIASVIAMVVACTPGGDGGSPCGDVDPRTWTEHVSPEDTGVTDDCESFCDPLPEVRNLTCARTGDTEVSCAGEVTFVCEGRRPPGLAPFRSRARSPLHRWATHAAWLEAASVPAFVRLAGELDRHGAPDLAARARAAARDEVRHAREVAATFGVRVPRVRVRPRPPRDLDALAIDNAIEGSGETLAAAVALYRAHHADRRWRPLFARIARDEARHAQLAWDVDRWLGPRARPELRRYDADAPAIPGLGSPGPDLGRRLAAALATGEHARVRAAGRPQTP